MLSGDEHVASYVPPANVEPARPGAELAEMLIDGEIDAVIGVDVDHPDVAPLIPDPEQAAIRHCASASFYPINHLVVVKDELLQRYPDVARAVFDAFTEAKQRYVAQLREGVVPDRTGSIRGCCRPPAPTRSPTASSPTARCSSSSWNSRSHSGF